MKLSVLICLAVCVCSNVFAASSAVAIFPIDQASIAVGAQFDFKIELPEVLQAGDVEIKIGGKPAAEILGVAPELIVEEFGTPAKKASAFVARKCVLNSANESIAIEVFVRKDKVAEAAWRAFVPTPAGPQAKNVIIMIGDGLSQAHRTAARMLSKGIKRGKYNGQLAMDDMPHMGLVGTSGMDSIITDSANSASAYTTGHKSANGALSVYKDRTENYAAKPADEVDDPACETIAEFARRIRGMATGAVTDVEIQDATPASMYAHIASRRSYPAIADMLAASNLDVIMGGGRASFSEAQFARFKESGYTVCETKTELLAAQNPATPKRLFGIFNPKNIDGAWDRKFLKSFNPPSANDQPDLSEMAAAALKVLEVNPNGFVLMIEGGRIDKYSHSLDWERAVMDTIQFDQTVALVKDYATKRGDTLVLVLGDHTHGMSIVGTKDDSPPHTIDIGEVDPTTGQLTKKTVRKQGRDYVRIYGDAGFPDYTIKDGYPESLNVPRKLAIFFTNFPDYYETFSPKPGGEFKPQIDMATSKGEMFSVVNESYKGAPDAMLRIGNLPRGTQSGVHTCEDVIITAMGPGSEAVRGFIDNTKIFEIMVNALGLKK
ncbi:MAG: alkaline phosphatase [Planctomycetota bacterium]